MTTPSKEILLALPPFSYVEKELLGKIKRIGPIRLHFLALGLLYCAFFGAAALEGALVIGGGVGVLQNPPFFIHLVSGLGSVPLVLLLIKRIERIPGNAEDEQVIQRFNALVTLSKTKNAAYAVAALVGVVALAYNINLSISYQVDIYDSLRYPLTFVAYQFVRAYLYLFAYPLVFAATPVVVFYLFRAVRKTSIRYRPFHHDDTGGLRKYFEAVDRPVYAVQSLAVMIALMNYIGWGALTFVPSVLAVAAPLVVTLMAALLFIHFKRTAAAKRQDEIEAIRGQQMAFYEMTGNLAALEGKECLELLERIEATERLVAAVKKEGGGGLAKYIVNLSLLAAPYIVGPFGELLARRLMESFGP